MAYPGNPPKGPAAFETAPLTPDDFDRLERLATSFRPSWELDDAPFTGAGSLSAGDIRALQGGGMHADVRATALGSPQSAPAPTSHAPAKPVGLLDEPANKVILDPGLTPPPPVAQPRPVERPVLTSAGPWAAAPAAPGAMPPLASPSPASTRRTDPPAAPRAPSKARPTFATEPSFTVKKSKTGLLLGGAAGAVLLVGGVMWLASGGSDKTTAAPSPPETVKTSAPSIPPPPPEQAVANSGSSASDITAGRAAAAAPSPPTIAATALPQAPPSLPPSRAAMAAVAPAPRPAPSPPPAAPKPATASRPKGPTIVRDVPF